jgi:hypothetical protein
MRHTGTAARIMKALAPAKKRNRRNSAMLVLPARNAPDTKAIEADWIKLLAPCTRDGCIRLDSHQRNGPFSAEPVCNVGEENGSDNTTGLEKAVHRRDEVNSIASRSKVEVFDKRRLA